VKIETIKCDLCDEIINTNEYVIKGGKGYTDITLTKKGMRTGERIRGYFNLSNKMYNVHYESDICSTCLNRIIHTRVSGIILTSKED